MIPQEERKSKFVCQSANSENVFSERHCPRVRKLKRGFRRGLSEPPLLGFAPDVWLRKQSLGGFAPSKAVGASSAAAVSASERFSGTGTREIRSRYFPESLEFLFRPFFKRNSHRVE